MNCPPRAFARFARRTRGRPLAIPRLATPCRSYLPFVPPPFAPAVAARTQDGWPPDRRHAGGRGCGTCFILSSVVEQPTRARSPGRGDQGRGCGADRTGYTVPSVPTLGPAALRAGRCCPYSGWMAARPATRRGSGLRHVFHPEFGRRAGHHGPGRRGSGRGERNGNPAGCTAPLRPPRIPRLPRFRCGFRARCCPYSGWMAVRPATHRGLRLRRLFHPEFGLRGGRA